MKINTSGQGCLNQHICDIEFSIAFLNFWVDLIRLDQLVTWFSICQTPSFTDCTKLPPLCASFIDGFGYFLDAIAKAKKLFRKYIEHNLKQVSLTKSFLAFAMAFNLIYSYQT